MKIRHDEKWYQRRLAKYFDDHFTQYEDDAEWDVDPDINQWLFYIPELDERVELTCDDNGVVIEYRYELPMDTERAYEVVKRECSGMDAVYEDYILSLVGATGFGLLRSAKLLTTCGSINGRDLYTLN